MVKYHQLGESITIFTQSFFVFMVLPGYSIV